MKSKSTKKHIQCVLIAFICAQTFSQAQVTGSFIVKGSINNYYPVIFLDNNWPLNIATELELGRSNVHTDATWRGSMISKFRYHISNWGNGSEFIDADIKQNQGTNVAVINFIAGWKDASAGNSEPKIIIWLLGGTTTYYYKANATVTPTVYDGVTNPLPFQETNGPQHTFKTVVDAYVNTQGLDANTIYTTGTGNNYFAGHVLIGKTSQTNTGYILDVNGNVRANKVTINTTGADFVFELGYKLIPLNELENFVKRNHHLPGIASAANMQSDGVELGQSQTNLLQKIEELYLYSIEQNKMYAALRFESECQAEQISELKMRLLKLTTFVETLPKK